jgi:ribonuclease HII
VILPADPAVAAQLNGVTDSKQMTPAARRYWAGEIRRLALCWSVGWGGQDEIDALGILPATRLALRRALESLRPAPGYLLLDYLPHPEFGLPCTALVKGDAHCLSIAAASVLAKTSRDARMEQLDVQYPGYGFAAHKGYGTLAHRRRLRDLGPSPIHRRSFSCAFPDELGLMTPEEFA